MWAAIYSCSVILYYQLFSSIAFDCFLFRNEKPKTVYTVYNRQTTTLVEDFVEYNVNFYPCVIRQHESISKFFLHVALLRYTLPTAKYNKNVVNIHSSLFFLTKKTFSLSGLPSHTRTVYVPRRISRKNGLKSGLSPGLGYKEKSRYLGNTWILLQHIHYRHASVKKGKGNPYSITDRIEFRSWSRFLSVSLLLVEQRHDGCEQFA